MKATKVNAGLAESNGRLLLGIWRDSLHVTCGLTAFTPGSAPGPTFGNECRKTLPFLLLRVVGYKEWRGRVEGGKGNEKGKEGEWKGRRRKGGKGGKEMGRDLPDRCRTIRACAVVAMALSQTRQTAKFIE